mgnify:CR=1 FL=1
MNNLKKYKISIYGSNYTIVSDEHQDIINEAAKLVDSHMRDTSSQSQIHDPKSLAILAALNAAVKSVNAQNEVNQMIDSYQKLLDKLDVDLKVL